MSHHVIIVGKLHYPNKDIFVAMKRLLVDGGWVKDGLFVDVTENLSRKKDINDDEQTIYFPRTTYRNLLYLFNNYDLIDNKHDLLVGAEGKVIVVMPQSENFFGYVYNPPNKSFYDLNIWSKSMKIYSSKNDPEHEDDLEYEQVMNEWRQKVVDTFIQNHLKD